MFIDAVLKLFGLIVNGFIENVEALSDFVSFSLAGKYS